MQPPTTHEDSMIWRGRVAGLHVSQGGVPKHAVPYVDVRRDGIVQDAQRYTKVHGGPTRAVCLLGVDAMQRLQHEGHPIQPGDVGENVLIADGDWRRTRPGQELVFEGGVRLRLLSYAAPCKNIRAAFRDGDYPRMDGERHPGEARLYAEVLAEGRIEGGAAVELRGEAPPLP